MEKPHLTSAERYGFIILLLILAATIAMFAYSKYCDSTSVTIIESTNLPPVQAISDSTETDGLPQTNKKSRKQPSKPPSQTTRNVLEYKLDKR